MSRITRKELKTDQVALQVEHGINFFEHHTKEIGRYGAIGAVIVVLIAGYVFYQRSEHAKRQVALAAAIRVQEAPAGGVSGNGGIAFPTQDAKDAESLRVFTDLVSKYSGTDEGYVGQYYLAAVKADQGKLAEAEKLFLDVSQKADSNYASLAKLSLAQIYFGDGRPADGEKALRDLIANPTIFVSKEQASITLARFLGPTKPAEARKLLEPLRTVPGGVSQVALTLLGELPPQ